MTRQRLLPSVTLCLLLTACPAVTRTPFQRMASEAAGVLAAAAETMLALDEQRLTEAYAQGSFVLYREALSGLPSELPLQDGAPESSAAQALASRVADAQRLVEEPCLARGCDLIGEARMLRDVSDRLLEAAGR
jgi:hypothetical protein